jgi:hypothetical protein
MRLKPLIGFVKVIYDLNKTHEQKNDENQYSPLKKQRPIKENTVEKTNKKTNNHEGVN